VDTARLRDEFDRQWEPWTTMLTEIPPSATREPGACGAWTAHDVVGHVQAYVRYHLVQVQAAFSHVEPKGEDVRGARDELQGAQDTLHARNEAIRVAGLSLDWQQLLEESVWLRAETFRWIDRRTTAELEEHVGWVEFWDASFPRPDGDDLHVHVRRLLEVPLALTPVPVWQFVLPDKPPDAHVTEHLGQLRSWLASSAGAP
jgi:hypothetical protein